MSKQILVDEDRYNSLEELLWLLVYSNEVNPEQELDFTLIWKKVFELQKNTDVLGPPKNLIEQYKNLIKQQYVLRCALAEIANMKEPVAEIAKNALQQHFEMR